MLFLLTGNVQTGKTRWLEALLDELAQDGVIPVGVLAPGVWRECEPDELVPGADGRLVARPFDKLGIDNVLLPQGERLTFARRRDLAQSEGAFNPESQSAAERLGWEISEDALARVNDHLFELQQGSGAEPSKPELLVIDEVGRLELLRNGGLTAALALLDQGPSQRLPHALAIVREQLLDEALSRFSEPWGGHVQPIAANEEGRRAVRAALLGE